MCVGAEDVSKRRLLRSVAVSRAMLSVWPAVDGRAKSSLRCVVATGLKVPLGNYLLAEA
jgi:hypothetical protein